MTYDQNKTPIINALSIFNKKAPLYFCMPAHHRGSGSDEHFIKLLGEDVLKYDLTETPITDDLHKAEGAIKEAEILASKLFGSDQTFFLVNGTTCGNEAMIISSVHEGDKILVARNCHKSILMGLIISGAIPIYIEPEISTVYNTFGSISPEKVKTAFKQNHDIKAFILVSPTYYGISSDLKTISGICHSYGALLLVDEAHGSHFAFSKELPLTAMDSDADMCSQSIHKTAGSMTQSSMLHIKGKLVDISMVDSSLKIVQSTSPSYILMASLDAARHNLAINGTKLIEHAIFLAEYTRDNLNKINGVKCLDTYNDNTIFEQDFTRIVFSIEGIRGFDVYDLLFYKYNICTEMADEHNVVMILSYADNIEQIKMLIEAIKSISESSTSVTASNFNCPKMPPMSLTPRKAYFSKYEYISLDKAEGLISGEMIAPYPPGIPIIYPGEVFTQEVLNFIINAIDKKCHIHGLSDKTMRKVKIIRL